MIRKILQFESVSQVLARSIILLLAIAIAAGLTVDWLIDFYFAGDAAQFAASAYLVGAFTGFVVAAPIVFAFFFAGVLTGAMTTHDDAAALLLVLANEKMDDTVEIVLLPPSMSQSPFNECWIALTRSGIGADEERT